MADTSLGLSDEEFMKQDPAAFLTDEVEGDAADQDEIDSLGQTDDDVALTDKDVGDVSEAQEEPGTAIEDDQVTDLKGDTPSEDKRPSDSEDPESLDTSKLNEPATKDDNPETKAFDFESAYKKVSEPFKANGAEIQVKDPEDIIRLMQMGANYNKKMASMKPHLKMIKMLENNGLLDEAKLHNLIDLSKKDPKAVARLIEESGIDPLDIDTAGSADYKPNDYSVSDKEYNLDQVLDSIKDTETFSRTIDVLTKEWDAGSKETISENPEIISIINTHMGNGVYEKVNTVLQQEKALGKLEGVSDVEAYRQIAENLHKNGVLRADTNPGNNYKDPAQVSSETEAKLKADADRNAKRKGAAPTRQTASNVAPADGGFLGLSDDEFMKKFASG